MRITFDIEKLTNKPLQTIAFNDDDSTWCDFSVTRDGTVLAGLRTKICDLVYEPAHQNWIIATDKFTAKINLGCRETIRFTANDEQVRVKTFDKRILLETNKPRELLSINLASIYITDSEITMYIDPRVHKK
mgnify:CR=1 FL=1|jgi:hypothetical protein